MKGNRPTLIALFELLLQAFCRAGHSFAPARDEVTSWLTSLLRLHGFRQVQSRLVPQEYRADTKAGQRFVADMKLMFRMILPFLNR